MVEGRIFLRKWVELIYLVETMLFIWVEKSTLGWRHIYALR